MANSKKIKQSIICLAVGGIFFFVALTIALIWPSAPDLVVGLPGTAGFVMIFLSALLFVLAGMKKIAQKSADNMQEVAETHEQGAQNKQFKVCRYCGSENKLDEVKCDNCGANLKSR